MRTSHALALAASACLATALIASLAIVPPAPDSDSGVRRDKAAPDDPVPEQGGRAYGWGTVGYYATLGAETYAAGLASEGLANPNLMLGARWQEMSADDLAGKGLDLDPRRLAAGMVMLHREAQESDVLRQRLPQEVKDSLWSVDPQEAAMGLAALRKAIQEDDELNFMAPIEMRLALQARIYVFPSPLARHYPGPGGIDSPSADSGYDRESSIRSAHESAEPLSGSPGLADLCRGAKERLVSAYPWIVGSAEWLGFEQSCRHYHSESVARPRVARARGRPPHSKTLSQDGISGGWCMPPSLRAARPLGLPKLPPWRGTA